MIGAIIGAAGGLASGLFGAKKSADAAKEQQRLIDEQERKNDAWYNRNYYQNYLDSAEAQAAIKRVENTLKKQNQEAKATATVLGSTPEAAIAQQQSNNEILDNVVTNLAAQSTQRKDHVDAMNMNNENNILNAKMQQAQAKEKGMGPLQNSGFGLLGNAMSMINWGK